MFGPTSSSNKSAPLLLVAPGIAASLLVAWKLLVAPRITSNKKLLGASGLTTGSKDATRGSWLLVTRSYKKLGATSSPGGRPPWLRRGAVCPHGARDVAVFDTGRSSNDGCFVGEENDEFGIGIHSSSRIEAVFRTGVRRTRLHGWFMGPQNLTTKHMGAGPPGAVYEVMRKWVVQPQIGLVFVCGC